MAAISNAWYDNENYAGTNNVSTGDDRFRTLSTDIQQRLRNGGLYWPNVNGVPDSSSGIHYVSADSLGGTEFAIYRSNKTTKAVTVVDTDTTVRDRLKVYDGSTNVLDLNAATSLAYSGLSCTFPSATTFQVGGATSSYQVVVRNDKRLLVLSGWGNPSSGGSPAISQIGFLIPRYGAAAKAGVITEVSLFNINTGVGSTRTVTANKYTAVFSGAQITSPGTGSPTTLLSAAASITVGNYGIRLDSGTTPSLVNTSINSGDLVQVGVTGGAGENYYFATVTVLLDY